MKPYIIIPAFNEEKHITKVLKKIKRYAKNIVLVDDGSVDNTSKAAKKEKVKVLTHQINLGKGAALRTGCDYAVKDGADVLLLIDADGQHPPRYIPRFMEALRKADIVFGERTFSKHMPLILRFGNWFLTTILATLFSIKVNDTQCGYRAFTKKAYKKIKWKTDDYSIESEMLVNAGKHKLNYVSITIPTIYLDKYKGTTFLDGIKVFTKIIWWRLT